MQNVPSGLLRHSYSSCEWYDDIPLGSLVISHIAINHLYRLTRVCSKIVPVRTVKFRPVFLQRYIPFDILYTLELRSNGDFFGGLPNKVLQGTLCKMRRRGSVSATQKVSSLLD